MWYIVAYVVGFLSCLLFLYWIGSRRHKGHGAKSATGPSSKSHVNENVVVALKKG